MYVSLFLSIPFVFLVALTVDWQIRVLTTFVYFNYLIPVDPIVLNQKILQTVCRLGPFWMISLCNCTMMVSNSCNIHCLITTSQKKKK